MGTDAPKRVTRWMAQAAMLGAFAATLAACHTTRVAWNKPGANQAALQSDIQACAEQARIAALSHSDNRPASSTTDVQDAKRQYDAENRTTSTTDIQDASREQVSCMLGRGWKLTPLPS